MSYSPTVHSTLSRVIAFSHVHARSNRAFQFQHYICNVKIALCAVTGTWLKHDDDIIMKSIPLENFDIILYPMQNGTTGGIALI